VTAPVLKGRVSFCGWKPGDVIADGLEIKELIGQGGMGAVWRVHHREWNRELAVKMPLPALVGSPTARERFLREAETWIDLGVHPHIVQCWFVKDISGLPSLFLDFLTGGSLKQWLVGGHLRPGQWQRILEIAIQVAEGLSYAHSRGVVHRDVKPANLLIRGDERVCVTDFGIVKTANDKPEDNVPFNLDNLPQDVGITGTGAFLGTPQYGAPEQWGAAEGVDQAADIYALGVTLYEMICGRRPFDTDEERTAPEVLIERHLDAKPPDPREFFPDIPSELAHMALLCLEKDPKRRPHDMERLKGALSSIYARLTGTPYKGVGSVPKEQRADILNNRAVSLHSLAKPREARDVWRRGLRIESGHPECLYNLTKLELLAGRIDGEEGLRRLRQAKAGLPLALLCIEEGSYAEAIKVLSDLNPETAEGTPGPLQRALGDAQMYAHQYYAAEKAYRLALGSMPADTLSHERKRLASLGKRGMTGKILFPSSESTFHVVLSDPTSKVVIDDDSEGVVGITSDHAIFWSIPEQCVEHRISRPEGASAPKRVRSSGGLILCEDRTSFELRRLPGLSLLGRKSGRILATNNDLRRMVVRERKGTFIFDVSQSSLKKLTLPNESEEPRLAKFDLTGELLCLMLQNGRIGQPDEEGVVTPEEWPTEVDQYESATCMALSAGGTHLYVGHSDGRLQGLNFATQTVDFDLDFGDPIQEILTTQTSSKFIVRLEKGFVLLTKGGRLLLDGAGAIALDTKRGRVLCFPQNRLELYSLSPFRRLRVWNEIDENLVYIDFAADGRRAVSQTSSNRFDVWEVDEDHRVFERSFLLTVGKSFSEIASHSKRFNQSFTAAVEALARQEVSVSYRQLQRARSVSGYAQRPEALDLNWQLLSVLRRGQLESVWERASIESRTFDESTPGPNVLIGEGEKFLVSFGEHFELYADDGNETQQIWSQNSLGRIMVAQLDTDVNGLPEREVLLVNHLGIGFMVDLKSGKNRQAFDLDRGSLRHLRYSDGNLMFVTASGEIGAFNIRRESIIGSYKGLTADEVEVFDWQPFNPLLRVDNDLYKLDLGARKRKPQPFKLAGYENQAPLCYTGQSRSGGLMYLGFEDGSLLICEVNKARPVFHFSQNHGPITGFRILHQLSVGVASTGSGKLVFWDLYNDDLLEELSAHRGGILSLDTSHSGRYLLTSGADDQVRLWETSWTATEEIGAPELPWMVIKRKPPNKLGRFFGFGSR
jgi:serine/threonine protein kinase